MAKSKSRRQRCADATAAFRKAYERANEVVSELEGAKEDYKSELEELKEELQSWLDNLPENLQQGSKADELQSAIDQLERAIGALDELELDEMMAKGQEAMDEAEATEFPGMR